MSDDTMSDYTLGHHESVLRSHRWRTAENSAAYLLPHVQPGMRILDVGCGPGTVTIDLARLVGPGGAVHGIDSSAEVVALARRDPALAEVSNLTFAVGDVMALDVPDGSYDVVHAHQVLQHLQDPVGALQEMRRVVRPGGLVAARDADYAAMTWFPPDPRLDAWLDVHRSTCLAAGADPDAGRKLLGWALQAGFAEVVPTASVWCFATPEDRRWWGELSADRITSSAVADRAVAAGRADRATLADMAAGWRVWAGQDDGWFAILHGEILCRAGVGTR